MGIAKNGTEYIDQPVSCEKAIEDGSIDVNIAMDIDQIAEAEDYDTFLDLLSDLACGALIGDIAYSVVDATSDGRVVLHVTAEVYDE